MEGRTKMPVKTVPQDIWDVRDWADQYGIHPASIIVVEDHASSKESVTFRGFCGVIKYEETIPKEKAWYDLKKYRVRVCMKALQKAVKIMKLERK